MMPTLNRHRLAAGFALAAIISCSDDDPTAPRTEEKIAFNTDRDGNHEIYLMNPDGTGLVNLTNNPADDYQPVWSPDGSKIAFTSERGGNTDIYVMNADGTDVVRLTTHARFDQFASWAGNRIAFERDVGGANFLDIFVMAADGTNAVNVTNNPDFARAPTLSRDGTKIAFQSDRDFDIDFTELSNEIFVMNVDGSNVVNLTNTNEAEDEFPEWSPDGTRLVFQTNRTGNYEIFVMGATGATPVNLSAHPQDDRTPSWSRDGSKVVFQSRRGGGLHLYVMNADGTNVQRLTATAAIDAWPAWRP